MLIQTPSFRDGALAPDPESRDSGFDASHRPGMTEKSLPCSPFSHGWYATTADQFGGILVIMRAIVAIVGLLALAGCMADTQPEQPTMYLSMANGGATLDPQA